MPFLNITTNTKAFNTKELLEDLSNLVSKTLNKPKNYIVINLIENPNLLFTNIGDCGALAELKSVGFADKKEELAINITNILADSLNVKPQDIHLEFVNLEREDVSIGGKLLG